MRGSGLLEDMAQRLQRGGRHICGGLRISAWVMIVVGVFLVLAALAFKEWGRAAEGGLFVVLGWYFLHPKE